VAEWLWKLLEILMAHEKREAVLPCTREDRRECVGGVVLELVDIAIEVVTVFLRKTSSSVRSAEELRDEEGTKER